MLALKKRAPTFFLADLGGFYRACEILLQSDRPCDEQGSQLFARSQHSAGRILEICLMKFFRVGTCLALLIGGIACTQASQSVTAPTAVVGGSTAAASDGSTLKVSAPTPVSPGDGERVTDRHPTLVWLNSTGLYSNIGVAYDLELSTPVAVVYSRTVGESPDVGAHVVELELDYDTVYSWRVRAHLSDTLGPWSSWVSFLSPTRPVAAAAPPSGGGGSV